MELNTRLTEFVSLNTIKYADPIQWDITRQYGTNTVVIDPVSGVAYLSVKPVPMGVSLSNNDYWTEIFDLGQIIGNINKNLTLHNDGYSTTSTFDLKKGDWVLWNGVLYTAIHDIDIGDAYVVDANIEAHSVEELVFSYVEDLEEKISDEAETRASEDERIVLELSDIITSKVGIEAQARANEDSRIELELTDLINSQIGIVHGEMGDLNDLNTTDKDSVVDAVNEIVASISDVKGLYLNVKDYGAVGDGVTDDTLAIQSAVYDMCDKCIPLVFPKGAYLVTSPITATPPYFCIHGLSMTDTIILYNGSGFMFDVSATASPTFRSVKIQNFTVRAKNTNCNAFNFRYVNGMIIRDILIRGFKVGIKSEICYCVEATKIKFFESPNTYIDGQLCLRDESNNWAVNSCSFSLENSDPDNYSALIFNPSANISFNDCAFEFGGGIFIRNNEASLPIRNVAVNDCYFEWMQRNCIRVHSSASIIYNMAIYNCYFNAKNGDNSLGYAVDAPGVYGLSVNACNIRNYTNGMLNFNRGTPNGYTINNCISPDDTIPIVSSNMEFNAITGILNNAPTTGIHNKGEFVWNLSPSGETPTVGWICTVGGTPGTWVALTAN